MIILVTVVSALWFVDNSDFIKTSNEQIADGYKWNWVGKNEPSGTPAITIDTGNNEYILYRLEK